MPDPKLLLYAETVQTRELEGLSRRLPEVHAKLASILDRPLTREALHIALDAILDIAAIDERETSNIKGIPNASRYNCHVGRVLAKAISKTAFSWTEDDLSDWELIAETDPGRWRASAATIIQRSPHVIPRAIATALVSGFHTMNSGSGDAPPILTATREPGRGKHPHRARQCEFALWQWIYREKGAGRRIDDAIREVADAVGCTTDAVKKWRTALMRGMPDAQSRTFFAPSVELGALRARRAQEGGPRHKPYDNMERLRSLAAIWQDARTPAKARPRKREVVQRRTSPK